MADKTMPTGAGTFCWFEHMTPDTAKSKSFYTKLFGWTTETMPMGPGEYTMWKRGNDYLGGMMANEGPTAGAPPNWLVYIQVDDIEASHRKAIDLGAKSCVPPTVIPDMGRFAVFTDPVGASFAIYQSQK